jgi:hypothetical protein
MGNIVKPMWDECPAVTRVILASYPVFGLALSMLGALTGLRLQSLLACSVYAVIWKFRVWTLVTSSLLFVFSDGMSFLMLLLELYMGMMYLPSRERELGSSMFGMWLLLSSAVMNLMYLAIMAILGFTWHPMMIVLPNSGLWPLIMMVMSQQVLQDPNGSTSFWGIMQIPNKWYPLFIVGLFSLLNQTLLWNLVAAIAIPYVAFRWPSWHLGRLLPSQMRMDALEQRCCCSQQRRDIFGGSWLASGGGSYSRVAVGTDAAPSSWRWSSPFGAGAETSSGSTKQFKVFGGTGNKLGDSSETTTQSPLPSVVGAPAVVEDDIEGGETREPSPQR